MNEQWTVTKPADVKSWDRIRFHENIDDPRPITWPPMGPWWISGFGMHPGGEYNILVAYVPHKTSQDEIKKLWPDASNIEILNENVQITYSDRFTKPDWWIE